MSEPTWYKRIHEDYFVPKLQIPHLENTRTILQIAVHFLLVRFVALTAVKMWIVVL
jgi:hypothetical protein